MGSDLVFDFAGMGFMEMGFVTDFVFDFFGMGFVTDFVFDFAGMGFIKMGFVTGLRWYLRTGLRWSSILHHDAGTRTC
jgi:hypothetical protein